MTQPCDSSPDNSRSPQCHTPCHTHVPGIKSICLLVPEHDHPGRGSCGLWSLLLTIHSAKELDSLLVSWFDESCILGCTSSKKLSKLVSVWISSTGAVHLNALNKRLTGPLFHVYQVSGSTSGSLSSRKGVSITFGSLLKWASKALQLTPLFSAIIRLSHKHVIATYKHLSSTKR